MATDEVDPDRVRPGIEPEVETHRGETPSSLETSAFVRPSILTEVTTSCANDIACPFRLEQARGRETGRNYVVKPDTAGGTDRCVVPPDA